AERSADAVYQRGKEAETALEKIDKLVDAEIAIARRFLKAVAAIADELAGADEREASAAQMRTVRGLEQRAKAVRSVSDRLLASSKSARHAFTARRYEDDARSNQDAAYLYEVKAHLSAARSDHHLARSKNFMYAMLIAQAGVAIATLAIAVRQKSVMWLLATVAGVAAIGFGVYVFLGME